MRVEIEGDRIEAVLIINGVVYQSDIDHQECLQEYYRDTNQKSPYKWDGDEKSFEAEHEACMHQTYEMKQSHMAYGFDLFDAADLDWVLIAHDEETLEKNIQWAIGFCKENNCKLAYFTSSRWEAEVIEDIEAYKPAV